MGITSLVPQTCETALPLLDPRLHYRDIRQLWWQSAVKLRHQLRNLLRRGGFDLISVMAGLPVRQLVPAQRHLPPSAYGADPRGAGG